MEHKTPYPTENQPMNTMYPNAPGPGFVHQPTGFHPQPPPSYDNMNNPQFQEPQYPQQQQFQQTTMVQTHVIHAPQVGPEQTNMFCPSCSKQIVTRVDYESSTKTHLFAGLLCLVGCWPCFYIPYLMDSCKNVNHYCQSCGAFVGQYKN